MRDDELFTDEELLLVDEELLLVELLVDEELELDEELLFTDVLLVDAPEDVVVGDAVDTLLVVVRDVVVRVVVEGRDGATLRIELLLRVVVLLPLVTAALFVLAFVLEIVVALRAAVEGADVVVLLVRVAEFLLVEVDADTLLVEVALCTLLCTLLVDDDDDDLVDEDDANGELYVERFRLRRSFSLTLLVFFA